MWLFKGTLVYWALVLVICAIVIYAFWKFVIVPIARLFMRLWEGSVALFAWAKSGFNQGITFGYDVLVLDTIHQREKIAEVLYKCAEEVQRTGDSVSLGKLQRAARSPNSFKRSYALDALGRCGWRASGTITTQIKGLTSRDPFVREAAAHALYRMGNRAAEAQSALVGALRMHRSEGMARYAVLALGQISNLTEEARKELAVTAKAENSCAAEEAAQLLKDRPSR